MRPVALAKWGPLGAVLAAACCLAASWLSGILTSVGVGFLAHYVFLAPFLALCLGFALVGSWRYSCEHHSKTHLWISLGGAVLLVVGLVLDQRVAYAGMALLIAAGFYTQLKTANGRNQGRGAPVSRLPESGAT
jgi:hypothetical protein